MKIRHLRRIMLVTAIILVMSAAFSSAYAQGDLLVNPGFEPPFNPVDGVVPGQVAQGWTPWFTSTEGALQPEYYPATDTVSGMATPRIHSGDDAQQYFTFFSGHVAGVYQHVTGITAGDTLEFSIFAWLWSSSHDDPDHSDPEANMTIEVGIDPTGGEDASSSAIVWSAGSSVYDQYNQVSVSATAQSDAVTVFVRSTVNAVLMNNVVYLDDASLTVSAEATAETNAEATMETTAESTVMGEPTQEMTAELTSESPTEAATAEVVETQEATPESTEAIPVVTMEQTSEMIVTSEMTAEIVETAEATEAVTPEETAAVSPAETEAMTPEVTAEVVTATVVPSDTATTEPTLEPTATLTPTVEPTIPTDTPTPVPSPTNTMVPPTVEPTTAVPIPPSPTPSPTLNLTVFPYLVPYTVQNGDIVAQIAQKFNTSVDAIIIANGLNQDAFIRMGQTLLIPVQTLPEPTLPPTVTPTLAPPVVTLNAPPTVVPTATEVVVQVQVLPAVPTATQPTFNYVVQYGDTLSSIASRFGTTTRTLARLNHIVNANMVYVGQVLVIGLPEVVTATPTRIAPTAVPATPVTPPTTAPTYRGVYMVQPGDTLFIISVRFGVRISDLMRLNHIMDANRIFVGQILYIP